MTRHFHLWWLVAWLGFLPALPGSAAEKQPLVCVVCGKAIQPGPYWNYTLPTTRKEVFICPVCKELKQNCIMCGLPVLETAPRTGDGRFFCPQDYPNVAVQDDEIRRLFSEAVAEIVRLSNGKLALQNPEITLSIFDVDYWNAKDGSRTTATQQRHGLSQSRPVGNGMAHTVLLHRGLWKDEMSAVCAHEYTHLWINENKPAAHTIEKNTIEAICEVVALALMESRGKTSQITNILDNGYTEGRIITAAKFYKVHGIGQVLDWVRDGKEPVLNDLDFQLSFSGPEPVQPVWNASGLVYRPTYEKLELKGIITGKERRVALINGKTFAEGESRKLEIGDKSALIKVLEIKEDSVRVEVEGRDKPVELYRN
jgi:hypothetical protein